MKNLFNNKLIIIGIILVIIFIILLIVITKIGGAYKSGLQNINPNQNNESATTLKINKIRKVTLKNSDSSCVEIMLDGAVRVYSKCDENIIDAGRANNQSQIQKLFKLISTIDLSKYKVRKNISDREIIIETDGSTETIYIPSDPNDSGQSVIDIIDDIKNDINNPSPIASVFLSPNASGFIFASPVPSYGDYSSPLPSSGDTLPLTKPFVCDFKEVAGKKKPFNVSNIICSTDPIPAP